MNTIAAAVEPLFLQALSIFIATTVAYLAKLVKDKFDIEIEARHREALQAAIMSGVKMAIMRLGHSASQRDVIDAAVAYAHQSVPDAINKLGPSGDLLAQIAESKLPEVTAAKEIKASLNDEGSNQRRPRARVHWA